jgi:hypothetical protein
MTAPGQVRIEQVQGLHAFASGVTALRQNLGGIGERRHAVLDLQAPGAAFPLADVAAGLADLRRANEAAVGRLAAYATAADRGLSGLAFVAGWIGTRFPQTDAASAQRLSGLVGAASEAVPPVPAGLPGVDPRFQSQPR